MSIRFAASTVVSLISAVSFPSLLFLVYVLFWLDSFGFVSFSFSFSFDFSFDSFLFPALLLLL
jgi:hypothetical protein